MITDGETPKLSNITLFVSRISLCCSAGSSKVITVSLIWFAIYNWELSSIDSFKKLTSTSSLPKSVPITPNCKGLILLFK